MHTLLFERTLETFDESSDESFSLKAVVGTCAQLYHARVLCVVQYPYRTLYYILRAVRASRTLSCFSCFPRLSASTAWTSMETMSTRCGVSRQIWWGICGVLWYIKRVSGGYGENCFVMLVSNRTSNRLVISYHIVIKLFFFQNCPTRIRLWRKFRISP